MFPIRVPPLRERREDIPELVRHFTARFAAEEGKTFIRGVSAPALQLLSRYDWPGNIRQLENAVFRAVVLADGPVLTPEEFPQIAAHVDGPAPATAEQEDFPLPTEPVAIAVDLPPADVSGQLSGRRRRGRGPPARRHRGRHDSPRARPL